MHILPRIVMTPLKQLLTMGLLAATVGGCVDVKGPVPKPLGSSDVLAAVEITAPAVMMVLSDTVQLGIRAIAMDNSEIPVDPMRIQWKSLDSSQVYVDSLGRVIGRVQSTIAVDIIATYRHERTTKADTIPVYVTATKLDATSIRLVAVDSTRVGTNAFTFPRIRVDLYRGDTLVMQGAQIPITAPKPVTITYSAFGGPNLEPVFSVDNKSYLGKFWIKAAAQLYGNLVADSIEFRGIYPAAAWSMWVVADQDGNFVANEMSPDMPIPNAQPCAIVAVILFAMTPIDIVFSDSTASSTGCEPIPLDWFEEVGLPPGNDIIGGNVLNLQPFSIAIRRSNTQGQISLYLRDAITKERIPISYRFNQVHIED
jgi:hypothetical protein